MGIIINTCYYLLLRTILKLYLFIQVIATFYRNNNRMGIKLVTS